MELVHLSGHLWDLACELLIKQIFSNQTDINIEAVYTFPLPYGAILTDLIVTIDDREFRGKVTPKKQAEQNYEEAISEGDGAFMLEQSDNGICD